MPTYRTTSHRTTYRYRSITQETYTIANQPLVTVPPTLLDVMSTQTTLVPNEPQAALKVHIFPDYAKFKT